MNVDEMPELLTPAEVARLFKVSSKAVMRWAAAGRLPFFRTPGGHRRFRREDVAKFLAKVEARRG